MASLYVAVLLRADFPVQPRVAGVAAASAVECGDLSPLSAGDLSPSIPRETVQLPWGARPPRAQRTAPSRFARDARTAAPSLRPHALEFGARARRTAAEAAALPPSCGIDALRRRQVACGKRRELAALQSPPLPIPRFGAEPVLRLLAPLCGKVSPLKSPASHLSSAACPNRLNSAPARAFARSMAIR